MIFFPPDEETGELCRNFEDTDNLKRTNYKTCQTDGIEPNKWEIPQDARSRCGQTKVKENTNATQTEAAQNQEAHWSSSRSDYRCVVVDGKENRHT